MVSDYCFDIGSKGISNIEWLSEELSLISVVPIELPTLLKFSRRLYLFEPNRLVVSFKGSKFLQ